MRDEHTPPQAQTALATGSATGGSPEAAIPLGPLAPLGERLRLPSFQLTLGARAGAAALAVIVLGALAVAAFASAGPSSLVPHSGKLFPSWEAGPLSGVLGHPSLSPGEVTTLYSALLIVMTIAYGAALLAARSVPMRMVVAVVLALNLIILMSPPLQLTDLFNYIGYARLGGLHALNPYSHVIDNESWDPVYRFTTWHNLSSPYGPLFTALSYPLAWLSLPVAYWLLKSVIVAASLAFIGLVWRCAVLLELDPRPAILFVAVSPLYVFFALGGFHNDFLMLVPSTAAIALLLERRDRASGAALAVAVAVKFTAIVLLPFLLIAARPPSRRLRLLEGLMLAAVPLIALSVTLFGLELPNLADQHGVVTGFSVPNLVGLAVGLGGSTPGLLRVANVLLVLLVLMLLRRPRDWIAGAGWTTMALVASVAWLMPWYLVWVLPLAALGRSAALRRTTLAFTVFLVLTFIPETYAFLDSHGLNPMSTAAGQAAMKLQQKLQK
jgi:glycosyl transferase family 87